MARVFSLIAALVWTLLIVRIVVPWGRFVDHPHWANVGWVPFVSPPHRVRDIILNTLLYIPLGASLSGSFARARLLWVIVHSLALTLTTEYAQLYSHVRFPSMTDVATNLMGAIIGALVATGLARLVGRQQW